MLTSTYAQYVMISSDQWEIDFVVEKLFCYGKYIFVFFSWAVDFMVIGE